MAGWPYIDGVRPTKLTGQDMFDEIVKAGYDGTWDVYMNSVNGEYSALFDDWVFACRLNGKKVEFRSELPTS